MERVASVPAMTVEGLCAYLAKFDKTAEIYFKKITADDEYVAASVPVSFTEVIVPEGDKTKIVVGLS